MKTRVLRFGNMEATGDLDKSISGEIWGQVDWLL